MKSVSFVIVMALLLSAWSQSSIAGEQAGAGEWRVDFFDDFDKFDSNH